MSKLIEVKVDASRIKNEITSIHTEAYKGLNAKSDNERRDTLGVVIEKLRTLKAQLDLL